MFLCMFQKRTTYLLAQGGMRRISSNVRAASAAIVLEAIFMEDVGFRDGEDEGKRYFRMIDRWNDEVQGFKA